MTRTSNIFVRVEPEIKEQAEQVLNQLGIPMSNAIGIFLRQVVYHQGIPFEVKLPGIKPLSYDSLTEEQFNAEIDKGIEDINAGRVFSAKVIAEKMNEDYGV